MKKKLKFILSILISMAIFGCGDQAHQHTEGDDHSAEAEAGHDDHSENKDEVHMVQKQMDVMDIELGKFQYLNLSTTVKSNGQLELPPQNKASMSAVMGGRVKSIIAQEGDFVKKGQTLATLEHPDFIEIQEQYMMAKSNLDLLEKDFQRKKALYADSISSTKVYEQSEAAYLSALAKVNGQKSKLQMLDISPESVAQGNFISAIPVRTPISGYVRSIAINMGMFVQAQQEMFEIVDNEHIHIDLMVYEKDMDKVKKGQKVIFSLSSRPDEVFQGFIFALGRAFEKEVKAMVVHAEIDNKQGNLMSGMYVDARIVTNQDSVRALPQEAIVSDGGLDYVFVLKPDADRDHAHEEGEDHDHGDSDDHEDEYVFRKIEVNIGAKDIGFLEVVPVYDLPAHVQIVTKGAFYLLAEMKKGEGGGGHHH